MKYGAARDLAEVDRAIELARVDTLRKLARMKKPASWYRKLAAGKVKPRRPWESRRDRWDRLQLARAMKNERRCRMADTPVPCSTWQAVEQARRTIEDGYLWAETRAATEVLHATIREGIACRLDELARTGTQEPHFYRIRAERLRRARRRGVWGWNQASGNYLMRFEDRSGLTHLDPSEARRRQAQLTRRLVPELLALNRRGLKLYTAVFSEPNVPAGRLAWGKRHLFSRFRRSILGGAFPEIVGAFMVQEDPLAIDGQSWNVHLNVILVVDPRQCTPLPPDLVRQLEINLPGTVAKLPAPPERDPTPPGMLSYRKLHFVWGKHQFRIRPLEARNDETLGKSLLEIIKYSAKWISSKQLDVSSEARRADGSIRSHQPGESQADPGPPAALDRGRAGPAGAAGDVFVVRAQSNRKAPGILDYPDERLAEWVDAGLRFRRVRGFGCLYRLGPDPLALDDEKLDRFCGEVTISPAGAVVTCTRAEFAPVNSTHGDKSGAVFRRSAGAEARAGP